MKLFHNNILVNMKTKAHALFSYNQILQLILQIGAIRSDNILLRNTLLTQPAFHNICLSIHITIVN